MTGPAVRSHLHLALGLVGAACVALGLLLWYRVTTSPGDDNPVALIGVVYAGLGALPARGLALWLRRRPARAHREWLYASCVALAPLALMTPVVLTLLFGR